MTPCMQIRHKIEGIEGNRSKSGEIRQNPTTIALAKLSYSQSMAHL